MTDLEFLERLRQELMNGSAWPDIEGVRACVDESDFLSNELRVYPTANDPAQRRFSAFWLICEWEVRPRRIFAESS